MYISYHRFKHIYKVLKSDELDIRNSPFDRFATLSAKLVMCAKGACDTVHPAGSALGLMLGTDEVLKAANREPIFAPFLGGLLNQILPLPDGRFNPGEMTNTFRQMDATRKEALDINYVDQLLNKEGEFPHLLPEDKKEFIKGLDLAREANDTQMSVLQQKMAKLIEDSKKK